jgi:hypothetical protein
MRIFLVGVMTALLTVSAYAQGAFGGGSGRRHGGPKSEQNQQKPKADEPVQTPITDNKPAGPFDPWRTMRDTDPGKTGKNPL